MSKTFAQIEATLPHSRKLRQLGHGQRWAYLCAHLTPLGGFIGMYRYPKSIWADDADLPMSEMNEAIDRMIEVGLIDYNNEDDFLRIKAWFLKKNAPENASRMASLVADYGVLDAPDDMIIASVAEFTVGSIKRAQRWKPDSTEWGKLRDVFKPFLATMRQNFEDDFHDALAGQLEGQNRAVKAELCAIMPSLEFHLEAPCRHPDPTVGAHVDETRRDLEDTKTKKDLDDKTHSSAQNVQPLTTTTLASVGDAEKEARKPGPRPETIAAARGIGAIR